MPSIFGIGELWTGTSYEGAYQMVLVTKNYILRKNYSYESSLSNVTLWCTSLGASKNSNKFILYPNILVCAPLQNNYVYKQWNLEFNFFLKLLIDCYLIWAHWPWIYSYVSTKLLFQISVYCYFSKSQWVFFRTWNSK